MTTQTKTLSEALAEVGSLPTPELAFARLVPVDGQRDDILFRQAAERYAHYQSPDTQYGSREARYAEGDRIHAEWNEIARRLRKYESSIERRRTEWFEVNFGEERRRYCWSVAKCKADELRLRAQSWDDEEQDWATRDGFADLGAKYQVQIAS